MKIDHLISGGRIIDGTGNPWRYGDVLIAGERIAAIVPPGSFSGEDAQRWDAGGRFVCPGFIDIQSHSVASLMRDGRSLSKVAQGVTTEIMGEIWTPAPVGGRFTDPYSPLLARRAPKEWHEAARGWRSFGDWLRAMEAAGVSPNIGSFLSGGTLRRYVMGMDGRVPSSAELECMRGVMSDAMEDGAFGVSYALIYPPDSYALTDEIVEVAKVVARHHGLYITHMRSESARILEGLEEAMTIGRRSGAPVEIYHLKASGRAAWPLMPEVIRRIHAARAGGLDISADMYPYEATGTGLASCLPDWVSEGGAFFGRLNDPAVRQRIRDEISDPQSGYDGQLRSAGAPNIMPIGLHCEEHRAYRGMRLNEIMALRNSDEVDTVCDLLAAEGQQIATIFFKMSEENTLLQLQQPWVTISSDAPGVDPAWARDDEMALHPRAYGTFPRVLGHYVRGKQLFSWEEAVRKMTSAVANRLRLSHRGRLEAGYFADLVIFDPETVEDRATFADPGQLPTGIEDVWVNGTPVILKGTHTGSRPGRFVTPG